MDAKNEITVSKGRQPVKRHTEKPLARSLVAEMRRAGFGHLPPFQEIDYLEEHKLSVQAAAAR